MSKKITAQMIFDAAWQAFIIEDRPPAMEKSTDNTRYLCRYLTKDGKKCAVGLCIPDGHPYQSLEANLDELVHDECFYEQSELLFDKSLRGMSRDELFRFQNRLHDDLAEDGEWNTPNKSRRQYYLEIAATYNLAVPGEEV